MSPPCLLMKRLFFLSLGSRYEVNLFLKQSNKIDDTLHCTTERRRESERA